MPYRSAQEVLDDSTETLEALMRQAEGLPGMSTNEALACERELFATGDKILSELFPLMSPSERAVFEAQLQDVRNVSPAPNAGSSTSGRGRTCAGCAKAVVGSQEAPRACAFKCGAAFCSKDCRHRSSASHKLKCAPQRKLELHKHLEQSSDGW